MAQNQWSLKSMKMKWKFDHVPVDNYLRITSEGIYNPTEHRQMMKEVISLPYWKRGMPVLLDNRKLSYVETSMADLRESSEDLARNDVFIGDSKIAFLTGSISDFEVIRRFELITEEDVSAWMHVFLEENQALRWLLAYRDEQSDAYERNEHLHST